MMAPLTENDGVRMKDGHTYSTSKSGKIRRAHPSSAKGHRHKAGRSPKPPELPKRNEKTKRREPPPDKQVEDQGPVPAEKDPKGGTTTVVNVDTVRETASFEHNEEYLGLLESGCNEESMKQRHMGLCESLILALVVIITVLFFPISICFCLTVIREHERAIVFRLGHLLQRKPKGPGLIFTLPFVDVCHKVDFRLKMLKIPNHTVVTKDLVSTDMTSVCYYRIENLSLCYTSLPAVPVVLEGLMRICDKEILANHTFSEILMERKIIARKIQVSLDSAACVWGIKVERADIEDIYLPTELQSSFATEAEAKRQAHVKVIAAEGERAACEALRASTDALSGSPATLQLRLLQLLHSLQTERSALVLNLSPNTLPLPTALHSLTSPLNIQALAPLSAPRPSSDDNTAKDSPMM